MGGKQYAIGKARTVNGVYYPSFDTVAHLLEDYGCLHFKFSILLGISEPAYDPEQLAAFKAADKETFEFEGQKYTKYEASQVQRKLETEIRRQKDRANIAKAVGDDDMRRQAQEKINHLTNKYKKFSDASGLPTRAQRMSVSGFRRVKTRAQLNPLIVNESRADELFTVFPPQNGDGVQARSVYKNLRKSEVGRETLQYIIENKPHIYISYTDEYEPGVRGIAYKNTIEIYAEVTKTVQNTTETLIHKITHIKYGLGGDQYAEAVCMMREKLHTKESLTFSEKKSIIKTVKKLYPEYKWRKRV